MKLIMRNDNVLIKVVHEEKDSKIVLPESVKSNDELTHAKFIIEDFDDSVSANVGLSLNKQVFFNPFAVRTPIDKDHFVIKQEDILAVSDEDYTSKGNPITKNS